MTKKIFFSAALALGISLPMSAQQVDANGYTTVPATMGANYVNRVFFDFSTGNLLSQAANNWDLALRRDHSMAFGTRVNDARGIKVYQVSANPADFDTVDIANISNWGAPLYNPSETNNLFNGALEQTNINTACSNPNFTYGWACYNMFTHKLEGKVVFVLKYPDNTYIKLFIDNYYHGYTFRYAKAGANGVWGNVITKTVPNGSDNKYFNYFSFQTDDQVANNEPDKTEWDMMFTRYYYDFGSAGAPYYYQMSGVIQNPNVRVAKKVEQQDVATFTQPADADYSDNITAIGHSYKQITTLIPDIVYYIKDNEDKYYRMYFTQNGGVANGNVFFKYKEITAQMATNEVNKDVKFGMYPNPAPNKQVSVIFDVKDEQKREGKIQVFDMSGRVVYETNISKTKGFFQKDLDLSQLKSGNYIVHFILGDYKTSKQLILK